MKSIPFTKVIVFTILIITTTLLSCNSNVPKDYVTLSGKIKHQNSDSLCIIQGSILKTISVNSDGSFKDTLKVETGNYMIYDGKEQASLYLENGFDLFITLDTKQFDESISFEGNGEEPNTYLAKKALLQENVIDFKYLFSLDETAFNVELEKINKAFENLLLNTKNLTPTFISDQNKEIEKISEQGVQIYKEKKELLAMNGEKSPKFVDYINHKGGSTSLDDLLGNYVYIDLWATWCAPCKAEIPFLKEIEKQYHGKNIKFVSISIDKKSAYTKWQNMVNEKELSGVQLFANEDKAFVSAFIVRSIPRFILIDPKGSVINSDAPRPSSSELTSLLKTLEI